MKRNIAYSFLLLSLFVGIKAASAQGSGFHPCSGHPTMVTVLTNVRGPNNPHGDLVCNTYDDADNLIATETMRYNTGENDNSGFTVIKGSDDKRREKVLEACNNSCEIHDSRAVGGDVVVIPDGSGRKKIFGDPGGEGGYRCLSECDDDDPDPREENGEGNNSEEGSSNSGNDGSGSGGDEGGFGGGESGSGEEEEEEGTEDNSNGSEDDSVADECEPYGKDICWPEIREDGEYICECGGPLRETRCSKKILCYDWPAYSGVYVVSCGTGRADNPFVGSDSLIVISQRYYCLKPNPRADSKCAFIEDSGVCRNRTPVQLCPHTSCLSENIGTRDGCIVCNQ